MMRALGKREREFWRFGGGISTGENRDLPGIRGLYREVLEICNDLPMLMLCRSGSIPDEVSMCAHKIVLVMFSLLALGVADSSAQVFSGGSGTIADPYLIANKFDLKLLSDSSGNWDKHFRLNADIALDSSDFAPGGGFYNQGEGFSPIGNASRGRPRFKGTFNGQNFTISGLVINRPNAEYQGFFEETDIGSTIENFGLENIRVVGRRFVGGLVAISHGNVKNCHATGVLFSGAKSPEKPGVDEAGGLIGLVWEGLVDNCHAHVDVTGTGGCVGGLVGSVIGHVNQSYSTGKVTGDGRVGGLVGILSTGMTITNSYAVGRVTGTDQVGGLVGRNYGGMIDSSYARGMVVGTNQVGGLCGNNTGAIAHAYATGTVSGGTDVGGLAGNCSYCSLSNTYATGDVMGKINSGGLVGSLYPGSVSQSYSIGSVQPGLRSNGLIGYAYVDTISRSFWDKEASKVTDCFQNGVWCQNAAKTTAQMKNASTYIDSGWDFQTMWEMDPKQNFGYPVFSWQNSPSIPTVKTFKPTLNSKSQISVSGSIQDLGILPSVTYGIVWNTIGFPEEGEDAEIIVGVTDVILSFTRQITGLQPNTRYFFRCFVKNGNGISYGNEFPLSTVQYEGSGTKGDPFQIKSKSDLKYLSTDSLNWDRQFALVQDIKFDTSDFGTGGAFYNDGKGFHPIGMNPIDDPTARYAFTGGFDGKNHIISGLRGNPQAEYNVGLFRLVGGLFGLVSGATIQNIGLTDIVITEGAGGLVGKAEGTVISNCYTTGKMERYRGGIGGGVAGYLGPGSRMEKCHSSVNMVVNTIAGGLVGHSEGAIIDCYASGSLTGDSLVGGLVGLNSGPILNSHASGAVKMWSMDGTAMGGLVGINEDTITNSYATGEVCGLRQFGGLVGRNTARIEGSFASGELRIDLSGVADKEANGRDAGGLVGANYGEISHCFASGPVLIRQYLPWGLKGSWVGGLAGRNGGIISYCRASGDVRGNGGVGGLVGLNQSESFANPMNGTVKFSFATGNIFSFDGIYAPDGSLLDSLKITDLHGVQMGGLVGQNGSGRIENSYSRGQVSGMRSLGGLVGETEGGMILNSYSTGRVLARGLSGGFLGGYVWNQVDPSKFVEGSFWDMQSSRMDSTLGGTGKTTAEMKRLITYTKRGTPGLKEPWDFTGKPNADTAGNDEWAMVDSINNGYPHLKHVQESPTDVAVKGDLPNNLESVRIHGGLNNEIIIDTENAAFVELEVYDIAGKKMRDWQAVPSANRNRHIFRPHDDIGTGVFASGNYYARIKVVGQQTHQSRTFSTLVCLSH